MRLIAEELPEILDVTERDIEQVFADEVFGKFILLSAAEDRFLQAACVWSPSPGCSAFFKQTGSEPYRLEYRDGKMMFAVNEDVTLEQVKEAFVDFLRGGSDWRYKNSWIEFQPPGPGGT